MPAAMPSGRPQQHPLSHARLPLGAHLDPFPRPPPVLCDPSLCPLDDLVEKQPCSWNSSRVCECRAGTFCVTSATNSCARCSPHSVCPAGKIVKFQGKSPDPQPRTPTCAGAVPTARPPDDFSPLTFCFPWDRPPSSHDLALGAPAAPSSHLCLRLRDSAGPRHGPGWKRSLGWFEAQHKSFLMPDKQERNLKFVSWVFLGRLGLVSLFHN